MEISDIDLKIVDWILNNDLEFYSLVSLIGIDFSIKVLRIIL